MNDQKIIQRYVNSFRKYLLGYLMPGIGIKCSIYPSTNEGAILEFYLGSNIKNEDIYNHEKNSVNDALKVINQKAFGGNLDGFRFGGTNVIMEANRIILIKGENNIELWNERRAKEDVARIVSSGKGGAK